MNKVHIHLNQVEEAMSLLDESEVNDAINVLATVRKCGGRVYVCGNGGSHATASHFVNDLTKICRMKAHCVGSEMSVVSAYGNDNGWAMMYTDALAGKLEANDCVVGISCSGNSENVINALQLAKQRNVLTIGLTGLSHSSQISFVGLDALVYVPVPDIRVVEDLHLMVCHAIVRQLQNGD